MAGAASKIGWKVVGKASGVVAGVVAAKGSAWAYRAIRKSEPPTQPEHPDTGWAEAIGWAALSAVALEVVRLAAERIAARGWQRATGALPPGMDAST